MAALMARADISIGAPGSATWERCTLGLPTLLVTLADNQVETARHLAEVGAALDLGWHSEVTTAELEDVLIGLAADPARLSAMSEAGRPDHRRAGHGPRRRRDRASGGHRTATVRCHTTGRSSMTDTVAARSPSPAGRSGRASRSTSSPSCPPTTAATSRSRSSSCERGRRRRRRRGQAPDLHPRHDHDRRATRPSFRPGERLALGRDAPCTTCTRRPTRPGSGSRGSRRSPSRSGMDCFSSPFDADRGRLPRAHGRARAFKVASFELVDLPLIRADGRDRPAADHVDRHGHARPRSTRRSPRRATAGATEIALLKCTSAYPSPPEDGEPRRDRRRWPSALGRAGRPVGPHARRRGRRSPRSRSAPASSRSTSRWPATTPRPTPRSRSTRTRSARWSRPIRDDRASARPGR